jgi:hypothetical protein
MLARTTASTPDHIGICKRAIGDGFSKQHGIGNERSVA